LSFTGGEPRGAGLRGPAAGCRRAKSELPAGEIACARSTAEPSIGGSHPDGTRSAPCTPERLRGGDRRCSDGAEALADVVGMP
jgi:hypothetical protein